MSGMVPSAAASVRPLAPPHIHQSRCRCRKTNSATTATRAAAAATTQRCVSQPDAATLSISQPVLAPISFSCAAFARAHFQWASWASWCWRGAARGADGIAGVREYNQLDRFLCASSAARARVRFAVRRVVTVSTRRYPVAMAVAAYARRVF